MHEFGADDLEGLQVVDHVGVDHRAHFNLVVLRFNEVLVVREVDQVRAVLAPQRTASDHARSSRTGAAEEALVQATEEATGQIS